MKTMYLVYTNAHDSGILYTRWTLTHVEMIMYQKCKQKNISQKSIYILIHKSNKNNRKHLVFWNVIFEEFIPATSLLSFAIIDVVIRE